MGRDDGPDSWTLGGNGIIKYMSNICITNHNLVAGQRPATRDELRLNSWRICPMTRCVSRVSFPSVSSRSRDCAARKDR